MQMQPLEKLVARFEIGYEKGLKNFLLMLWSDPQVARQNVRDQTKILGELPAPTSEVLFQSLRLLTETDLREPVSGLSVPTQIVAGANDRIVNAQASQWLAKTIPGAECKMLDCGHLPFVESKPEFMLIAKQFFS